MKMFKFAILFFCLVLSSLAFGEPKKLNDCLNSNPDNFDARFFGSAFNTVVLSQIYEPLIKYNSVSQQFEPALATSWSVSDDGLTYTFNLRKGVKFHTTSYFRPTRDFNADDVLFSINSQLDNSSKYYYAGNDGWLESMGWKDVIKEVEAVDNYTVKFVLKEKRATFLLESTMYQSDILSKEYADKLLKQKDITLLNKYPIGTGAYQFVNFVKDSSVSLQAHTKYWGGVAKTPRLDFIIETDKKLVVTRVVDGDCDYAAQMELFQVNYLRELQADGRASNINIIPTPLSSMTSLMINVKHNPALANTSVRQAIFYAINYKKLYSTIFNSDVKVANSGVPSNVLGWSADIPDKVQDVARAKELLNASGINPANITLNYIARPNNQEAIQLGEAIKADLSELGITVNIDTYNWKDFLDKVYTKGDFDLVELGWLADIPDASNFLDTQFSCASAGSANPAFYCNKEFDALGKKAMETTNQTERNIYFAQQQKILNTIDVVQIPLVEPIEYEIVNASSVDASSIHRRYTLPQFKDFELK